MPRKSDKKKVNEKLLSMLKRMGADSDVSGHLLSEDEIPPEPTKFLGAKRP